MEFFHFMRGFLSSAVLGFHCTKNNLYREKKSVLIKYTYLDIYQEIQTDIGWIKSGYLKDIN